MVPSRWLRTAAGIFYIQARAEVMYMSKKQDAAVVLGLALGGGVVAHRVAAKQAQILGISVLGLAVLGWMVSAALS